MYLNWDDVDVTLSTLGPSNCMVSPGVAAPVCLINTSVRLRVDDARHGYLLAVCGL